MATYNSQKHHPVRSTLLAIGMVGLVTGAGITMLNLSKASTRETSGTDPYGVTATCPSKTLKKGSVGPCVIVAQSQLNAISGTKVTVNGTYDTATELAVSTFQVSSSLPTTGTLDEATWTKLLSAK